MAESELDGVSIHSFRKTRTFRSNFEHFRRNNDITDILDLDFTSQYESFGTLETLELKPGGVDIPVTEDNKLEYIDLLCEHRLKGRVENQLDALRKGLQEIVPLQELRVFDEKELEVSTVLWSHSERSS